MRAFLFSLIHALVTRHPRTVSLVSLILAAVAGIYGTLHMEMITDQDRLLSEELPYHHRYMNFVRNYGDLEFIYILIEGPSKERMAAFADALAARLRQSDDVKDVVYEFDTAWAKDYALYFEEFPLKEIRRLREELEKNRKELESLFRVRSVDEILLEISRSIQMPGGEVEAATTDTLDNLDDLAPVLAALRSHPPEGWAELYRFQEEWEKDAPAEKRYNWSGKGNALLMLVMPDKDYSTLSVIEEPLKRIRADIWLTKQEFPDVNAGMTGRPVLQADEMRTTNDDMQKASILAFFGVALLYIIFYRELARPVYTMIALLCAMGWTYGFVALTLGHLNLLSLVFALTLIGLGADFGIHFLHRYQEGLQAEGDPSRAVTGALHRAGPGILTGAVTTSVAFLLAMLTDFLGLAELGYVAGIGILFCLAAMLITLPAFYVTHDRHFRRGEKLPVPLHLMGLRHASRYPRALMAAVVIATLGFSEQIGRVRFDDNLLEMQAEGLESVEYEHKLIDESQYSTWYCAFVERSMEDVRRTVRQLQNHPTVAGVDSLHSVLPDIPPGRRAAIQSLRDTLAFVTAEPEPAYYPNSLLYRSLVRKINDMADQIEQWKKLRAMAEEAARAPRPSPEAVASPASLPLEPIEFMLTPEQREMMKSHPEMAAQMLSQMGLADLSGVAAGTETPPPAMPELPEIPEIPGELVKQLETLKELAALLSGPEETVRERLRTANRLLFERPRQALRLMSRLARAEEPTPEILPPMFNRLFVGNDGSYLIMAYPKENIWETEHMKEFVDAMRAIDPEVTGTPIQVYESSQLMRNAFLRVGLMSLGTVSLLVLLDFGSISSFLYVMTTLLLGIVWMTEIMGFFEVHLNLANFFAIPILIGIGVDNAVHFQHRFLENYDVEESMFTSGTTLTLTTLTTAVGFGSLMFASHKGLASMGVLMTLGAFTCWFSCIIFLPTLLKLLSRKYKNRQRERIQGNAAPPAREPLEEPVEETTVR
ncbi:MAG TPA: MMPL family transporter [bacterium]|nr:MMPL family transporter [bacterium]HXK95249.1 MMPL family transporter [bacterium]